MAHQSNKVTASLTTLSPKSHHNRPDEHEDLAPSDIQPAGVDEEVDYDSLEEALTS